VKKYTVNITSHTIAVVGDEEKFEVITIGENTGTHTMRLTPGMWMIYEKINEAGWLVKLDRFG
jgi:hypothetical protein